MGRLHLLPSSPSPELSLAQNRYNNCCMQHIWAHVRRKFFEAAAGSGGLKGWESRWLERIGKVFRLNRVRLRH